MVLLETTNVLYNSVWIFRSSTSESFYSSSTNIVLYFSLRLLQNLRLSCYAIDLLLRFHRNVAFWEETSLFTYISSYHPLSGPVNRGAKNTYLECKARVLDDLGELEVGNLRIRSFCNSFSGKFGLQSFYRSDLQPLREIYSLA